MAIDTAQKRASAIHVGLASWRGTLPFARGAAMRRSAAGWYIGGFLLAGVPMAKDIATIALDVDDRFAGNPLVTLTGQGTIFARQTARIPLDTDDVL